MKNTLKRLEATTINKVVKGWAVSSWQAQAIIVAKEASINGFNNGCNTELTADEVLSSRFKAMFGNC